MKERPILFSAPMVRALLDGTKTQTRRACKPMNAWVDQECREVRMVDGAPYHFLKGATEPVEKLRCPYGQPGDRLWVRESFALTDTHEPKYDGSVDFRADGKCYAVSGNQLVDMPSLLDPFKGPWRPSIHMPRWASRILLEVVSVRTERLKAISVDDAVDEGIERVRHEDDRVCYWRDYLTGGKVAAQVGSYRSLWESINGAGSWDANPWVWVVEFKRVAP